MKNYGKTIILLTLALTSFGCSQFLKRNIDFNPADKSKMETRISECEQLLDEQNYSEALDYFSAFQKEFPHSLFDLQAKIGKARSLTGLEKWSESLSLLQEVTDISISENQPRYIGLAAYYNSLNYEALGEEPKTFAALKDAERFSADLPLEISKAELPARFAVYYNRNGNHTESQKYFRQAEQGISVFLQKNKELSAKNFFQMGYVSTGQANYENLPSILSTLEMMQIFSLRAIEAGHKKWSTKALQNLKSNYQDLWNAIQQIPKNPTLDPFAAEQDQKESQFKAVGLLLNVIQKLRTYQRIQYDDNPLEKDLYAFFDELEVQGQKMMISISGRSTLTPETQSRKKLKKEGLIRSRPIFPSEKEQEKWQQKEDPNLKGNSR